MFSRLCGGAFLELLTPSPCLLPDAKDLRSQGKLKLGQLMADFKLVAKSFAAEHAGKPAAGSVLFARMEFSKAKDLFGRWVWS